jgi:YD repeat-containing protein
VRRTLGLILTFVCAAVAFAQQHPSDARGFSAEHVYDTHDVDSINAYNGNLIVHLPIGPEYPVNGGLSYRFGLTYNSHLWRFDANHEEPPQYVSSPVRKFNGGLGWQFTLGKLFEGNDPNQPFTTASYAFQSKDGADHALYGNGPWYSSDGSHLELSAPNPDDHVTRFLEFPDGTKYTFNQLLPLFLGEVIEGTSANWSTSTLSHEWFLTSMADRSGNSVTITYSTHNVPPNDVWPEVWTISDAARTNTAYFRDLPFDHTPSARVIDHVDLKAFGAATATYRFVISAQHVPIPIGDNATPPSTTYFEVPLLEQVTPPLGPPYSMTLSSLPAYELSDRSTSGVLKRLTLPTLGAIGWSFAQQALHPVISTGGAPSSFSLLESPAIQSTVAVRYRSLYKPGDTLPFAQWSYKRAVGGWKSCEFFPPQCPTAVCTTSMPRQVTTAVTEPGTGRTTISYFSNHEYIPGPTGSCNDLPEGWLSAELGLPFTRYVTKVEQISGQPDILRYLSTEVRGSFNESVMVGWDGPGKVPASGTPLRETYVTYQLDCPSLVGADDPEAGFDFNAMMNSTATYFLDDTHCGPAKDELCYSATNFYAPDGVGHFRQSSSSGNFPGGVNFRTTFTNYNPTLTTSSCPVLPPDGTTWILNTATEQCMVDETSPRRAAVSGCGSLSGAFTTKTQYDANTGALTARRTLAASGTCSGQLCQKDLLATFTYDRGLMKDEKYFGGDLQPLDTTNPFAVPGTPTYSITHALTPATGIVSHDVATYANDAIASDSEYDVATGSLKTVRDVSGLATSFTYDLLGRYTTTQPPGVARSTYTYGDATGANAPASVTVRRCAASDTTCSAPLTESRIYFDALGRVDLTKTNMPAGWSAVRNEYDAIGRLISVSMPQYRLDGNFELNYHPTDKATTTYDVFGRALSVTTADGKSATNSYLGGRSISRSRNIWTGATNGTDETAVAEEIYDGVGRLFQVKEPEDSTPSTTYTYDSADRLTDVVMIKNGATQTRHFDYDHRGFVKSETHPELGVHGNGTTSYSGYDARGRATGKVTGATGGAFDLTLTYDGAERLTEVKDLDSFGVRRTLKKFVYDNDSSSLTKGRLKSATRYNHPSGAGEVAVVETYTYDTTKGVVSGKSTEVKVDNTTFQTFSQSYGYDELAEPASITYPTCPGCSGTGWVGTLSRTFSLGRLTGVGPYASSITYHPDGMVNIVTHPGGVTDTQARDPHSMPRPDSIVVNGYTTGSCPSAVTVTPASSSVCVNVESTATVTALGGASYAWTITGGSFVGATNGATVTFTSASAGPVVLQATVTPPGCPALTSPQASVSVVAWVSIQSASPADPVAPIAPGGTATLTVSASGSSLHYVWHQGTSPNGPVVGGDSATFVTPQLSSTTSYWVHVTSDCGAADSRTATVTVLAAPASVQAVTGTPTTKITVSWSAVAGATDYMVRCAQNVNGPFTDVGPTAATTIDYNVSPSSTPVAYVCKVASRKSGQESPAASPMDYAVTATTLFIDEPIQKNVTLIRAAHIVELRKAVDAVRAAASTAQNPLPPLWQNAPPPSGVVTAGPLTELYGPFNAARWALGLPSFAYSAGIPTPASNVRILSEHVQEVRNALR